MKVKDMMKAGIILNFLSVLFIYLFARTVIGWVFL